MNFLDWLRGVICKPCEDTTPYKQRINELENSIVKLTPIHDDPDWLEQSQDPYDGQIELTEALVRPKDARDYYAYSEAQQQRWEQFRGASDSITLNNIWQYIGNFLTYSSDRDEDWQTPIETENRQAGDCEDGTILFVTIANALGITDCYNACGVYTNQQEKFGHSFPIAKLGDKWYVFETTEHPWQGHSPVLLQGSNYDCSYGLSNSFFKGKLKSGTQI